MGTPLVAGRDFTWTDLYDRRNVALVSENMARELWHDPGPALGKRVREGMKDSWREIVGVVADVRQEGADQEVAQDRLLAGADVELLGQRRPSCSAATSSRCVQPRWVGEPDESGAAGRLVGQPGPPAGARAHDGGGVSGIDGAQFVRAGDAGNRRRHGAAAGHSGNLRRDLVLGIAADARVRHPHRAGRAAPRAQADGGAPGRADGVDWRGRRTRRGCGAHAAHVVTAVPYQPCGSSDVRGGSSGSDRRGGGSQLPAGETCVGVIRPEALSPRIGFGGAGVSEELAKLAELRKHQERIPCQRVDSGPVLVT